MKIAFIRQKYTGFGGAELYVSRLAALFLDRGHEVHMLAREWGAAETGGLIFHRLKAGNGPAFVRLGRFAREAARAIESGGYDLVYSFERTYGQDIFRAGDGCHREWLARRAAALGPVRAALDSVNPRHRAFLALESRMFADPRLKVVIANSRQGREEIIRHYGLPEDKVRVIYNGVDRQRFHPGLSVLHREEVRRELKLEADEPTALFVGSGYLRKGLTDLLKALTGWPGRLIVVGKDQAGPFERMASRLGVRDRVLFLGPRSDVERFYGGADVFVLPSWYEPFGNVALEAMVSGLPVVIGRDIGMAEAVREGSNGYLHGFPPRPGELAEKIGLALKLETGLLRQTNEEALRPYDWDRNLAETLEVCGGILGRSAA